MSASIQIFAQMNAKIQLDHIVVWKKKLKSFQQMLMYQTQRNSMHQLKLVEMVYDWMIQTIALISMNVLKVTRDVNIVKIRLAVFNAHALMAFNSAMMIKLAGKSITQSPKKKNLFSE